MNTSDTGSEIIEDCDEIIEDCDAFAVLLHADGCVSLVLTAMATELDEARAFSLVPADQVMVGQDEGEDGTETEGDRYFSYIPLADVPEYARAI